MTTETERLLKMTSDQRADEYIKNVSLSTGTYKGDVQTAFVMAISQERKIQQEWFRNLWEQQAEYRLPDPDVCQSCGSPIRNCIC